MGADEIKKRVPGVMYLRIGHCVSQPVYRAGVGIISNFSLQQLKLDFL